MTRDNLKKSRVKLRTKCRRRHSARNSGFKIGPIQCNCENENLVQYYIFIYFCKAYTSNYSRRDNGNIRQWRDIDVKTINHNQEINII